MSGVKKDAQGEPRDACPLRYGLAYTHYVLTRFLEYDMERHIARSVNEIKRREYKIETKA